MDITVTSNDASSALLPTPTPSVVSIGACTSFQVKSF